MPCCISPASFHVPAPASTCCSSLSICFCPSSPGPAPTSNCCSSLTICLCPSSPVPAPGSSSCSCPLMLCFICTSPVSASPSSPTPASSCCSCTFFSSPSTPASYSPSSSENVPKINIYLNDKVGKSNCKLKQKNAPGHLCCHS